MRTKLTASHPRPASTERAPLRPGAPRRPRAAAPAKNAADAPAEKSARPRAASGSGAAKTGHTPSKTAAPRTERTGRTDRTERPSAEKPGFRAGASSTTDRRSSPRSPADRARPARDDARTVGAATRSPSARSGAAPGRSPAKRDVPGGERSAPRAPYTPRGTERPRAGERRTDAAEGERSKPAYARPPRSRDASGDDTRAAYKSAEKPAYKRSASAPSDTGGRASTRSPSRSPSARPYAKPGDTSAAKPYAKAADKPAAKSAVKPAVKPAVKSAVKSINKPPSKPFVKTAPVAEPVAAAPVREDDGTVRLSKRMSEMGLCSRREADEWIEKGWVRVDGEKIDTLGTRVRPEQKIEVIRQAREQQNRLVTILLHKPVGHVSGQPEDGHPPAAALILPDNRWIHDASRHRFEHVHLRALAPAGRLDIDSTGLLVFTQDGRVAKQLIGESSDVEKEYLVRVNFGRHTEDVQSHFPAASLQKLRHGLSLDDVPLRPAQVDWQNGEQLRFVLREGKKRQIRRMCELVGLEVVGLKRVRIGQVMLGSLPVGEWRYLADNEVF